METQTSLLLKRDLENTGFSFQTSLIKIYFQVLRYLVCSIVQTTIAVLLSLLMIRASLFPVFLRSRENGKSGRLSRDPGNSREKRQNHYFKLYLIIFAFRVPQTWIYQEKKKSLCKYKLYSYQIRPRMTN